MLLLGKNISTSSSYLQYHSTIPSGTFDLNLAGGMTVSDISLGASVDDVYNAFTAATNSLYNVRVVV